MINDARQYIWTQPLQMVWPGLALFISVMAFNLLGDALQYELPVLVLNLNNRYLGMVKQWQDMLYSGRHSQSYMESLPDFVRLAEAYGHVGIRISEPQELETKLAEALEQVRQRRLVFVDVTVDGSEHVYPMQIRGGGMDEMWLSKTERT